VETRAADTWTIGKQTFTSRLLVGTGKYKDFPTMQRALTASGAEVVTVVSTSRRREASRCSPGSLRG
jgi:thiazole synthase